ncbi:MAG: DivIVA domain-containing protein [Selenomonadaceae bacterium]
MLTPVDIHNKDFKRSFRGYNEDEIDDFLDRVGNDYEKLYRENRQFQETIDRLEKELGRFQQLETTLHETLVVAQKTAEEVKNNAQRERDNILLAAKLEADKMITEAAAQVEAMQVEYRQLEQRKQMFSTKLRTILLTELELLGQADAGGESVTDESDAEQAAE